MKVIVAGFSKTGTQSMCAALKLLGYETHGYVENFWYHGHDWQRILRDGATVEDFKRMYKGVDAVSDLPVYFYWEEILEAFPESKVIMMTRDVESWLKSYKSHIVKRNADVFNHLKDTLTVSGWQFAAYRGAVGSISTRFAGYPWSKRYLCNDEATVRRFLKHRREIEQNCPKEKLLVCEIGQGWKPICEFLGVEIPQLDFPHNNKGGTFLEEWSKENRLMRRMQVELYISLFVIAALAVIGLWSLFNVVGFL